MRERRDRALDEFDEANIQINIDSYMVDAILIPFEIANLCMELARYSIEVFDLGWTAVRGDSGVAIENALAAIGGSTFVITLNLSHISTLNEFASNSRVTLNRIESLYEELKIALVIRHKLLRDELKSRVNFKASIHAIEKSATSQKPKNYKNIEELARKVHLTLSKNLNINSDSSLNKKIKILNARRALGLLGYKVAYSNKIGSDYISQQYKEVDGVCDNKNKIVTILKLYSEPVERFTVEHDLGHVLLHGENTLFRDIHLDGRDNQVREFREIQATNFSAHS